MTARLPDPRSAECFVFSQCRFEPGSGEALLGYRFDEGPELLERIRFPDAPWPLEGVRRTAFERALQILHLVAGVSYYKAGLASRIRFEEENAAAGLGTFMRDLFQHGLAEFAYVNGLNLSGRINFPASRKGAGAISGLDLPERALLAMGGGKDSLVGLSLVQQAGLEVLPAAVGGSPLIRETANTAGLPLLQIGRQLAPELAEMNRQGAWNGHVPVTAINSAVLLCAAILYGYRHIVFSNERSADEPTLVTPAGQAVNHQYSKSSEFERAFRAVIAAEVSPAIEYFSIVRPLSEVGVVRLFSELKEFHSVFSSCNRNFHLDGSRIEQRWCCDCPKCRFAALALALFLPPDAVTAILGADLLDDMRQESGFRALARLGAEKPFECVGEAGESRAALRELSQRADWRRHAVVRSLAAELEGLSIPSMEVLLTPSDRHCIPARLAGRLADRGAFRGY